MCYALPYSPFSESFLSLFWAFSKFRVISSRCRSRFSRDSARPQVPAMAEALGRYAAAHGGAAAVGLCMGAEGRLSRVAAPALTFCTHPRLPGIAAPCQLSVEEVRLASVL